MSELSVEDIELLYNRYGSGVLYRCRQLLRDETAAWDAMHQTFVKAIKYRTSFRGDSEPRTWLFSIANRVCVDEMRARGVRDRIDPIEDDIVEEMPRSIEDRLHQKQLVARLLAFFNQKVQEIVLLRFFDELEVSEISKHTGLSERTVARRLNEFFERSKRLLQEAKA